MVRSSRQQLEQSPASISLPVGNYRQPSRDELGADHSHLPEGAMQYLFGSTTSSDQSTERTPLALADEEAAPTTFVECDSACASSRLGHSQLGWPVFSSARNASISQMGSHFADEGNGPCAPLSPSASSPVLSSLELEQKEARQGAPSSDSPKGHPRKPQRKFALSDDLKIAVGRMQHGCSLANKHCRRRGSYLRSISGMTSVRDRDTFSVRNDERQQWQPLRKTTSLLVGLEDETTSHEHTVVKPREGVMVQTYAKASLRQATLEAIGALVVILVASTLFYTIAAQWTLLDALYFSIVTLTTVGYGDVVPKDMVGRLFALLLFFLGAGVVGSAVGTAFTVYLDESKEAESKTWSDLRRGNNTERHERITRKSNPWRRLRKSLALVAAWTIGGALAFSSIEPKYSFLDACYWAGASLTTVGYGDIKPKKRESKLFAIFYLLGGTYVVLKALGSIAAIPIEAHRQTIEAEVLSQYGDRLTQADFLELTRGDLVKRLDVVDDPTNNQHSLYQKQHTSDEYNHSNEHSRSYVESRSEPPHQNEAYCSRRVTKTSFAIAMLVKLGKIDVDDVEECFEQFRRLDHHGNGYLEFDDVDDDYGIVPDECQSECSHQSNTETRKRHHDRKHKRAVTFNESDAKGRLRKAAMAAKAASRHRRNSLVSTAHVPAPKDVV